jgi:hypothetical protein
MMQAIFHSNGQCATTLVGEEMKVLAIVQIELALLERFSAGLSKMD